jgi:hypothetical protein
LNASLSTEAQRIALYSAMRGFPTITLFNPSAGNAQIRNETTPGDCSATATQNISDNAFEVTCTINSGNAAGDWLGVHWVADARL